MLKEIVRHMSARDGKEAAQEESGIKAVMNAEQSQRRYAELRKYKHPANRGTNGIEIPDV